MIFTSSDGIICGRDVSNICKGDSGGPVVSNINGQFTLIGLSSFTAEDGCHSNEPGYYADVSYSENLKFIYSVDRLPGWIEGKITKLTMSHRL